MNPTHEPASSGSVPSEPGDAAATPYGAPPPDGDYGWYAPGGPLADSGPRRRPWRRTLAVGALTALAVAALGVPLGLLWSWLSPTVPVGRSAQGEIVVTDPSPEQFVAADGWFTLLGLGFGVAAAIAAWLILRRDRGPALLLGVVVGALGAAGVAWQVGRRLGLADYDRWQQVAAAGETFDRPPDLHAHGPLLVPAFAAVIVSTLLAGWSNDPDLDVPGARPGYGHDIDHTDPQQYGPYGPPGEQIGGPAGEPIGGPAGEPISSGSPDAPGPTAAPAPPGPGSAGPPRG